MIYIYHLRDTLWVWDDWNVVENLTSTLSLVLRSVKVDSMRNKNEGSEICDYRKRNKKWFRDLWFKWHWNLSLSSPWHHCRGLLLFIVVLWDYLKLSYHSLSFYTLCVFKDPKYSLLYSSPSLFFFLIFSFQL